MYICIYMQGILFLAYLPPLNDCAEVYAAGGTEPGYYLLKPADPTGDETDRQPRRWEMRLSIAGFRAQVLVNFCAVLDCS